MPKMVDKCEYCDKYFQGSSLIDVNGYLACEDCEKEQEEE